MGAIAQLQKVTARQSKGWEFDRRPKCRHISW